MYSPTQKSNETGLEIIRLFSGFAVAKANVSPEAHRSSKAITALGIVALTPELLTQPPVLLAERLNEFYALDESTRNLHKSGLELVQAVQLLAGHFATISTLGAHERYSVSNTGLITENSVLNLPNLNANLAVVVTNRFVSTYTYQTQPVDAQGAPLTALYVA